MMGNKNQITLKAYAKINLSLHIKGTRDDGYHLLDSVFVPINIYDEIVVKKAETITLQSNADIPLDENNTAYKAASVFAKEYNTGAARIEINKRIPTMAGLGGGSADAAAVLMAMNEIYGVGASAKELAKLGESIGADVPFFLSEGASRVQGIGNMVEPIDMNIKLHMLILKPYESLNTKVVYNKYDFYPTKESGDSEKLIQALEKGNLRDVCNNVQNDLEKPAISICSEIRECLHFLDENEAVASGMTGSGSCVFGIFANANAARDAMLNYYGAGKSFIAFSKRRAIEIMDS